MSPAAAWSVLVGNAIVRGQAVATCQEAGSRPQRRWNGRVQLGLQVLVDASAFIYPSTDCRPTRCGHPQRPGMLVDKSQLTALSLHPFSGGLDGLDRLDCHAMLLSAGRHAVLALV